MLKKILYLLLLSFSYHFSFSQVIYSERFNGSTLNAITYTVNSTPKTYLYADVPSNMTAINNGNLIADTLTGNYPFRTNGQKQKAWLSYVPVNGTDTFAVSTSWLNPAGQASAWLITPGITISANSVLTWEAIAPDINNADGYEIYVSTNTTTAVPIVGDFTTQIFGINAEANTWTSHGLSLASYAGQTIRIAFKNNASDKYQLWLDDIKVENISNQYDISTVSHSIYKYSVTNANNTISAVFKNNAYTPITNLTINYQMNNGSIVSESKILPVPLQYLESREITFSTLYSSTTAQYNTFKIWITDMNGQTNPDQNHSNDTITGALTISASKPPKKVLVENFTSATYGWSPNGYEALKSIASTNTNVIATSLHNNDNMYAASTSPLSNMYNTTNGTSSAMIDRYIYSPSQGVLTSGTWNSYVNQRQAMVVPATVSVTNVNYNAGTRQITADVSANFVGDVKGQYAINLSIKENNVYGPLADSSDNLWNQHNALHNIPSSPYYQYGNFDSASGEYIMSAASYKHQYVINDFLEPGAGDPTVVITSGSTTGQTYTKTYTYTLPNPTGSEFRYNADNIYLIGVLSEYDATYYNGFAVLNSNEAKLTSNSEVLVGVKELTKTDIHLNVFPNPATDVCHLNYTLQNDEYVKVSVYNTLGELVYIETKSVNAGNVDHILNINHLNSGNYSVQVSFKNNSVTKKLTIIK